MDLALENRVFLVGSTLNSACIMVQAAMNRNTTHQLFYPELDEQFKDTDDFSDSSSDASSDVNSVFDHDVSDLESIASEICDHDEDLDFDDPGFTVVGNDHMLAWLATRTSFSYMSKILTTIMELGVEIDDDLIEDFRDKALGNCPVDGTLHTYDETKRCVGCNIQLCINCQDSFLSHAEYAKEVRNAPFQRVFSLAAARVMGTCGDEICALEETNGKICECMDWLTKKSLPPMYAKNQYHCRECIEATPFDDSVKHWAHAHHTADNKKHVSSTQPQYICHTGCGSAADTSLHGVCVFCHGSCELYPIGDQVLENDPRFCPWFPTGTVDEKTWKDGGEGVTEGPQLFGLSGAEDITEGVQMLRLSGDDIEISSRPPMTLADQRAVCDDPWPHVQDLVQDYDEDLMDDC